MVTSEKIEAFWVNTAPVLCGLVILFLFMLLLTLPLRMKCSTVGRVTERHTEFYVPGGCFIEDGDMMVPYGRWINLDGPDR